MTKELLLKTASEKRALADALTEQAKFASSNSAEDRLIDRARDLLEEAEILEKEAASK